MFWNKNEMFWGGNEDIIIQITLNKGCMKITGRTRVLNFGNPC